MRYVRAALASVVAAAMSGVPLVAQAQAPMDTPASFYLAYRAAFDKATGIEDLFPYHSDARVAEMKADPPSMRATKFEFMKMLNPLTDVKVVKDARTPTGARLTVTGVDGEGKTLAGTVTLVREHGAWKIDTEDWPD